MEAVFGLHLGQGAGEDPADGPFALALAGRIDRDVERIGFERHVVEKHDVRGVGFERILAGLVDDP